MTIRTNSPRIAEFDELERCFAQSPDILPREGNRKLGHVKDNVRLCAACENTPRPWVDRAAFKRVRDIYRKSWDSPSTVKREDVNVAEPRRGEREDVGSP